MLGTTGAERVNPLCPGRLSHLTSHLELVILSLTTPPGSGCSKSG